MIEKMRIEYPYSREKISNLKAGDIVYISGPIIVMRDAAHARFFDIYNKEKKAPFSLSGEMIYYMGPCPKNGDQIVGSAGPTTSKRMDKYIDKINNLGVICTIGKGDRSKFVYESIIKNKSCYLAAVGGAGAYYSSRIKSSTIIDFEDLSVEAASRIEVEDFMCVVAIDSSGRSVYEK